MNPDNIEVVGHETSGKRRCLLTEVKSMCYSIAYLCG